MARMKRKPVGRRTQFADELYLGPEPDLRGCVVTDVDLIRAYSWYNYFYDAEAAKRFTIAYCKEQKFPKKIIATFTLADKSEFASIGWNCRMLSMGATLPDAYLERMRERMKKIAAKVVIEEAKPVEVDPVGVVPRTIQERTAEKLSRLIGDVEGEIDGFLSNGFLSEFRMSNVLVSQAIKPALAHVIAERYKPLQAELQNVLLRNGDGQLKEAYAFLKKSEVRKFAEFVSLIVSDCEAVKTAAPRKTRKSKPKTAAQITRRVLFAAGDDKYNVKSISPTEIVGATSLWVYDSKRRVLGVYQTSLATGFTVKGTTLIGFDAEASIGKKLRKPEETLKAFGECGKVALRKFMDSINAKPKALRGRFNRETVLLKAVK